MTDELRHIPFQVEVSRIIEVLARQIYQSPLALLRENAQNAFDAILLRQHLGQQFDPQIEVEIVSNRIVIRDNGIGMTPDDLKQHYWRAGSSSKNNPEARRAGVVGTFGIGAMANFGIADKLSIDTESAVTGERTLSSAEKASLSTTEDCISLQRVPPRGMPGTSITAEVTGQQNIDVQQAVNYIGEFVAYVRIPVYVNGSLLSQKTLNDSVPNLDGELLTLGSQEFPSGLQGDVELRFARGGDIQIEVTNLTIDGRSVVGELRFRQGVNSIRTYRSGFGLATVGLSSVYRWGGVANLSLLQPTAGREALTTQSMQVLQSLVSSLDDLVSEHLSKRPAVDNNAFFLDWVRQHGRYELCDHIRCRVEPGNDRVELATLRSKSNERPVLVYGGNDSSIISSIATDDSPLVVLAGQNPRRTCESEYLNRYCTVETVQDAPTILEEKPASQWSLEEQGVVFRITSILQSDYFLQVELALGKLSHNLPLLVDSSRKPPKVVLDSTAQTFSLVCELYRSDYNAFGGMSKDFVRNLIFPRVADLVPSSTRQGAEAFLKTIGRTRDLFEYERDDLSSLTSLWQEYLDGTLTISEAASRATFFMERNVQVVDASAARAVREVLPDVAENEAAMAALGEPSVGPAPPIMRTDVQSDAKLLTIGQGEPAVKGYRCFIALSDRARDEKGEFFLQPHATSIVWGGQKLLFIFEHHSGQFGLYYDLQATQAIASESGGGPFPTATIVLKDRIYIPIPESVASAFIPKSDERKRLEVRCDLLFTE